MPMITEISPIFGLSLLELVEFFTILTPIAILAAAAVTGGFSWYSIRQSKKQIAKQLETQNKIASANLVRNLLKAWRVDSQFTNMLGKLDDSNTQFNDEDEVHGMLTEFEDIAVFWNDKLLDDTHVREFFGRGIVQINANESIKNILKSYHDEDPANNYNNLMKLIKHSECWAMKP